MCGLVDERHSALAEYTNISLYCSLDEVEIRVRDLAGADPSLVGVKLNGKRPHLSRNSMRNEARPTV